MNEIRRERAAVLATDGLRRISWGAITAGALLALAIQFMLGLLGLGIGLASIDGSGDFDPNTFASVSGLWTIAVVLVGLFVGAYAAGRLAGSASRIDAALHGIVTWATSTLLVVFLLSSGASAVLGAAFGAIGGSIQGLSQASSAVVLPATTELQTTVEEALRPTAVATQPAAEAEGDSTAQQVTEPAATTPREAEPSEAIATVLAGLGEQATPDQRRAASQLIARRAGISQGEAQQRLQQLQRTYDSVRREARQAADEAASAVTAASFAAFVALALGLVVGAVGGLLGRPKAVPVASRL